MNCLATRGLRPPARRAKLGLEQQLLGGNLDVVLLGKLLQNGLEPCLFRPLEGDRQAEPGGKAHQLLPGVGFVDVITGAV